MPPSPANDSSLPATLLRSAGLGVALYLGFLAVLKLPCFGGGCDAVLHSRWAAWLGVPLGFYGAAVWLVALLGPVSWRRGAHHALAVGSLGLIALQAWVIGRFCPWCLAHAALAFAAWPDRQAPSARWAWAGGLVVAGVLLGGQLWSRPALPVVAAPSQLSAAGVAWLSSAPTDDGSVLVLSLTCPRCLDLLQEMRAAPQSGRPAPRLVFLTNADNRALTQAFLGAVFTGGRDLRDRFFVLEAALLEQRELAVSRPAEAAQWFAFTFPASTEASRSAEQWLTRQQAALTAAGIRVSPLLVQADGSTRTVTRASELSPAPR